MAHDLDRLSKTRYVSPFDLGRVSLVLGDEERALNLFEEAYRQRSTGLIFLRDSKFAGLRDASRFQLLVEKLHFKS
jgi:hypothetical protein